MSNLTKDFKNKISLKEFEVVNTSSSANVSNYSKNRFDPVKAEKELKIEVQSLSDNELEFDMVGFDTSVPNAIRRILLSEVPSMAIEKVHLYQNTSIMQDEVLAHRLGLIPLSADPRLFEWKAADAEDEGEAHDTLQYQLQVRCRNDRAAGEMVDSNVYTSHMKWLPMGEQAEWLTEKDVLPTESDILINKMRPGHEMDMKLYAVKGIGRDHAKFSPVATAFYRLMPSIKIIKDVEGEAASRLQKCFSPGVIELEPGDSGKKKAVVVDERLDSCSRNVYRYEDLKECVELEKIKDHFIFRVESVGAVPPQDLVGMACDVLAEKCDDFLKELESTDDT